ncbi:flagellar biosynthetic protein FlhB [Roseibium hamelinense]|uniref:Flagellar biosynthetic protein FlhB n=1 Tax=Roseibium hamelinense TaxID=150831 RepID=A0A562TJ00_9HYPH|nr:flagellar biosynthesis protein FlhB [Roseibium hamelinense]MTI45899.1 flagellar biosynthesis protein FlhB [Roseibium hamelinense]TWI92916.1 flagellar biosynthetic protein FlhB [Roseibium hamelinense]
MSDDQDKDSKTEEPTEKKIQDALEKGNIPTSKEAPALASFVATLLLGSFVMTSGVIALNSSLMHLIDNAGGFRLENGADALMLAHVLGMDTGIFLAPLVITFALAGLSSAFLQNRPRLVAERIKPDLSKLSLIKGWKRVFGAQGWVEFFKAIFKFSAVSIVAFIQFQSSETELISAMFVDPSALPETILQISMKLVGGVCVITILLVAVDILWSRTHWRNNLRMTKQEIKDEHKQIEGDPIVKARQRSLARDRARNRMMAAVPDATLIVANPTHFAVALKYESEKTAAPVVVAKGQDLIALKIRQIAEENDVPVIEDKLLARSLYSATELDRMIPPEFYRAVAEIISYVYSRNTGKVG